MNKKDTKQLLLRVRKTLDKGWSFHVRERDNYTCQICGKTRETAAIHAHHIIPREFYSTRWDLLNGVTLCSLCHKWGKFSAHQNALWFVSLLENRDKERVEYLKKRLSDITNRIKQEAPFYAL